MTITADMARNSTTPPTTPPAMHEMQTSERKDSTTMTPLVTCEGEERKEMRKKGYGIQWVNMFRVCSCDSLDRCQHVILVSCQMLLRLNWQGLVLVCLLC